MTDRWSEGQHEELCRVLRAEREWWVQAYEALLTERDQLALEAEQAILNWRNAEDMRAWERSMKGDMDQTGFSQIVTTEGRIVPLLDLEKLKDEDAKNGFAISELQLARSALQESDDRWAREAQMSQDRFTFEKEVLLREHELEKSKLLAQLQKAETELNQVRVQMQDKERDWSSREQLLGKQIDELSNKCNSLAQAQMKPTEISPQNASAKTSPEVLELKRSLDEQLRLVSVLQGRSQVLEEQNSRLQVSVATINNDLKVSKQALEDRNTQLDNLSSQLRSLQQVQSQPTAYNAASDSQGDQKRLIGKLEDDVRGLRYQISTLEDKVRESERRRMLVEADLQNLQRASQQKEIVVSTLFIRFQKT